MNTGSNAALESAGYAACVAPRARPEPCGTPVTRHGPGTRHV